MNVGSISPSTMRILFPSSIASYPDILGGKYVVVVAKVGEERSFVLTAYLTGSVKTGVLL